MENLNQIINNLNKAQRQAVEQIYGPVLVLAGPGTGKTHLLTTRIAHILQGDAGAGAENILCLTFTENAAVEMRNRLQTLIGSEAYKVKIFTFHGFCQWVIDHHSSVFERAIGPRTIADDLQKALVFRKIITQKKWRYFSSVWDDFAHQYDFLKAVSDLKRENLTPDALQALIPAEKERLTADPDNFYKRKFKEFNPGDPKPQAFARVEEKVAKMYELVELWQAYEAEMKAQKLYDFDDLINVVVTELAQNQNLRLDLQERFQWILVDEYQDTNNSQNAILWQLCEGVENPNLFAVGDDDQSIYRFQGASVANVQDFRTRFPERFEITLTQNYRSHQHILDAAYASVAHNQERANAEKKLTAHKTSFLSQNAGTITQAALSGPLAQTHFLADTIKAHLQAGVPAHEMAILVRKNREIKELSQDLPRFGIGVSAQISQNIFECEAVRQLILMLQVFSNPAHDERLFDLLHADFLQLNPASLLQLSLAQKNHTSVIETLLQEENLDPALQNFVDFLTTARRDYAHARASVTAEKFLYESGLAQFLTQKKRLPDWQCVRKFLAWIREQTHKEDFKDAQNPSAELHLVLEKIDLHHELSIPIFPDPLPQDSQSVRIMTAHKSKGLEFEVVFIPSLEDKAWGNNKSRGGVPLPQLHSSLPSQANTPERQSDLEGSLPQSADLEEERRLFFVALTRAKSQIYLSYSQADFGGRAKNPALFWHEIPEPLVTQLATDALEDSLQNLLPVFFTGTEKSLTNGEKELLQQRVQNFRWSASSLQTYLDCPRKFLYQYLYRFPRRPLPQLALGVALHQALERTFTQLKTPAGASLEFLLAEYESALRGQNLAATEYQKFLPHGQEILSHYHQQKLQNFTADYPYGFELEYDFDRFNPQVDDIKLTGKMDKIVYLDEKKTRVKIVDYKSGRPRAINRGDNYWRQLVFYALLAQQTKGSEWMVESCDIEFLTPDSQGKLGTRSLAVSAEDKAQVITELKQSHQAVMNLEFPLKPNLERDKDIDYWQNFGQ